MGLIRLMKYSWQQKDWPDFKYEIAELEAKQMSFIENLGLARGA